ncbi:cellulose-binding protein [Streptomyces sp. NBC_00487]|uniref:cellulose-binding protein n=1 Tax=unclassified Streptomyces TaxID=2593676 RepID=UPI002E19B47C|nr:MULTISPECIES: cellulose-binding protein [unclassified Streptomyces]
MSSAPTAPHGFEFDLVRRGYRPEQVDAHAVDLSRDRDAAWERAARLTVLAREMGTELDRLRETVAGLTPQTYEALGGRARELYELGVEEATAVREGGRHDARRMVAEAEEAGLLLRGAAQAYADEVRGEAEERARHLLLAAQAEADDLRKEARRGVKEGRGEALAALREMRERTEGMLAELEKEYGERVAAIEREVAEREAAFDAGQAERVARAEAALAEAEQGLADAEADAARMQEEAEERAAESLTEARRREEWVARETERVLREHGERWDDVRAHMDCIRDSLSALTD